MRLIFRLREKIMQSKCEMARLAVENSKYEGNQKKLKTWISDYKQRDGFDIVLLKEVVDILEEFVVDV